MGREPLELEQAGSPLRGQLFVSYSRADGAEFALELADKLEAGTPSYRVWLDQRDMLPSRQDWDDQLTEAIQTCAALLFVMTKDSVQSESGCKDEWVWALKYKKPVIPIRVEAEAELPFRLVSREFLDFSESQRRGMAQLRRDLGSLGTAEGQLRELEVRLAEAERELPRVDSSARTRVEDQITELRARIEAQRTIVADPQRAATQTEERIGGAIQRERRPERRILPPARAKFVNPRPMNPPSYFQDRHIETGLVADFLRDDGARLITVVGRGGVGKTAMVCRLLKALEGGQLPDGMGELTVDGIVYLSPRSGRPVDFEHVFSDLCRLLPEDAAEVLLDRARNPHGTPAALMRALLECFSDGTSVLLLDNFEDIVDAEGLGLTDAALEEALRIVLTASQHSVKVIITTRIAPRGLLLVEPGVQRQINVDEGLPHPFAEEVLRAMDPDASLGLKHAPDSLLAQARERTRGFPRALEALKGILAADRDTTLDELLVMTQRMPENVVEALVGEAFNRLDTLAQQVMQALAVYTAPVPPVAVDYLLQRYDPAIDSAPVLARLVRMQFVRRDVGRYYLHQVDRDYALERLDAGEPSARVADRPPFTRRALRERAADYFRQTRTPRETWQSLDDIAPQRAEFDLRCQTGDYDTAAQILLDIDEDSLQVWGHIRLSRDLHERLKGHIIDPWTDGIHLNQLALCYEKLGQSRRAIDIYEQALARDREVGNRSSEGVVLGNLGVCYARLGETRRSIELYEQALAIDRETGNRRGEVARLHNLGRRHADLGEYRRAIELYGQALTLARETGQRPGEVFILNSLAGSHAGLGETRRAIELYTQSLAFAREAGHRPGEAGGLGGLGRCYAVLGQTRRAIAFIEQGLGIARDIGARGLEAADLCSLASSRADLGETRRAIELYEEALNMARDIGDRKREADALIGLAVAHADDGAWQDAIRDAQPAVRIMDEIRFARGSRNGRVVLATVYLDTAAFDLARTTAEDARSYDHAPASGNLALILGIALLRTGNLGGARAAFREAMNAANALLALTADAHDELDTRALGLCGLALVEDSSRRLSEACETFRAARGITVADGIVARVLRLFDALAASDKRGMLASARSVAGGDG